MIPARRPRNTRRRNHWRLALIRIATIGLLATALSAGAFAQGGRGNAPPPRPLEPGAAQAEVDVALVAAPANLMIPGR